LSPGRSSGVHFRFAGRESAAARFVPWEYALTVHSAKSNFNRLGRKTSMFNKTMIAISVAIAFDTASGAFAAPVQVASNKSPQYSSPDSTPNGPFFYVETLGVPPKVLLPPRQPRRAGRALGR
jgi:hypothetical protein